MKGSRQDNAPATRVLWLGFPRRPSGASALTVAGQRRTGRNAGFIWRWPKAPEGVSDPKMHLKIKKWKFSRR